MPADWRAKRLLTRVVLDQGVPFLNVDGADTLATLQVEPELVPWWELLGVADVELATVAGSDRRITRRISQWAFDSVDQSGNRRFAGIRYTSRLGDGYECWALFEGAAFEETERYPILVHDADMCAVAKRYDLTVH